MGAELTGSSIQPITCKSYVFTMMIYVFVRNVFRNVTLLCDITYELHVTNIITSFIPGKNYLMRYTCNKMHHSKKKLSFSFKWTFYFSTSHSFRLCRQ